MIVADGSWFGRARTALANEMLSELVANSPELLTCFALKLVFEYREYRNAEPHPEPNRPTESNTAKHMNLCVTSITSATICCVGFWNTSVD